jgi:hypothetical protein
MSWKVAKEFYDLVEKYKDDPEFKVDGHKPKAIIYDGACNVDFQYDVDLFGSRLCTVYRFDCVNGDLNFYDIKFKNQIYKDDFFTNKFKGKPGIGTMVVARWDADEKERATKAAQTANANNLEFLKSFKRGGK